MNVASAKKLQKNDLVVVDGKFFYLVDFFDEKNSMIRFISKDKRFAHPHRVQTFQERLAQMIKERSQKKNAQSSAR